MFDKINSISAKSVYNEILPDIPKFDSSFSAKDIENHYRKNLIRFDTDCFMTLR